ncbi:MAG TPA: DUF5985 family protein [Nitrospira sp.]|nr:DUF5985 family protein [Nitrospira sp.]
MEGVIYGLCTLTAFTCAWLLLLAYRRTQYRLLLWTGIFFAITTANNLLLMWDKLAVPAVDLTLYRYLVGFAGLAVLLPGLIFERE